MKNIENLEENTFNGKVRKGDELLPRVTPNASVYGYFIYEDKITGNYYFTAAQSIAYNPDKSELVFGVKTEISKDKFEAFVYITDMNLAQKGNYTKVKVAYGGHMNDMMFSSGYKTVLIATSPLSDEESVIREYPYPDFKTCKEWNLQSHFENDGKLVAVDSLCHCAETQSYIVKGGNKIIFFDYNFNPKDSIEISLTDLHGEDLMSQTLEYYRGHILHMNAAHYNYDNPDEGYKGAFLNVNRPGLSNSTIETYKYPSAWEAEGICKIGNGKYLITYYEDSTVRIILLNFNTPSHTHTYSDFLDLNKLGTASSVLHVNPLLDSKSYLAPDGSPEKPFPNVTEAIAYAKVFQPEAVLHLMDGNYGTICLSGISKSLTLKGMNKETCLIDKIRIDKCKDVTLEGLTLCNGEAPLAVTSSTVEINHCSFPNGRQSGSDSTGNAGINIAKDSTVILQDCRISHFDCAVNISASTLYLEGTHALKETGNRCGIRSECSVIQGVKDQEEELSVAHVRSLTGYMPDSRLTRPDTVGRVKTNRAANPGTGDYYFDSGAGKTLWWNGTNWVDATGTEYLP